jgi:aldehyde:ferredoxin oxidoreductase
VEQAVSFLVEDERSRCLLTSCVGCLFARKVYTQGVLAECLESLGWSEAAGRLEAIADEVQQTRWRLRLASGYDPRRVPLPRRFAEVNSWKGAIDLPYLQALRQAYAGAIEDLGRPG